MKFTVPALIIAALSLSACVTTAEYPADNPKQMQLTKSYSAAKACSEYDALQLYYTKASLEPLLQQAVDQGGVRPSKLSKIRDSIIELGMNETEVTCSWGRPNDVNTSIYSFGTHKQYVYGGGQYAYFENGKLTAIQQ